LQSFCLQTFDLLLFARRRIIYVIQLTNSRILNQLIV